MIQIDDGVFNKIKAYAAYNGVSTTFIVNKLLKRGCEYLSNNTLTLDKVPSHFRVDSELENDDDFVAPV